MKNTFKIITLAGLICGTAVISNCRPQQPVADIGFSCQRLASCYANYSSELKDSAVRSFVEQAQSAREENRCVTAIQQLSTAVNKECPF